MKLVMIIFLIFIFIQSRHYTNTYSLISLKRNKGWMFLDRITFQKGTASINIVLQLFLKQTSEQRSYNLQLAIIPDHLWNTQILLQCNTIQEETIKNLSYFSINLQLNQQNGFHSQRALQIDIKQEQTYHFVIKDCKKILVGQSYSRQSKLDLSLHMLNNGKQYGEQDKSNFFLLPLLLILSIVMIKINNNNLRSSLDNEIDWVKLLLVITLWINLAALFSKLINYILYVYVTGKQYAIFDFVYLLFHSASESVITCLLIFVSYGWTVTFMTGRDFDLYIPLLIMLGLVNIILTLLNKINDNQHDKYHMYDSIPAYILIFFRVVSVITFFVGICITYTYNAKNISLRKFYKKFFVVGISYFLSLPILMLFSCVLPSSYREQFIFISIQGIKNVVNIILTYMISSKKSNYKEIKYTNQSFMMDKQQNKYL